MGVPQFVDVTFELSSSVVADHVTVVGDFNDWSPEASPMKRTEDGSFRLSLLLATGRTYRYRYLIDGVRWENDWQADNYLPNPYGGDDSVVDLTPGSHRVNVHAAGMPARPSHTEVDEDEKAVRSIPLDTDDGDTVVIEQQNVGPGNQVGGGEFKNGRRRKTVNDAQAEQRDLEARAPVPKGVRRSTRGSAH